MAQAWFRFWRRTLNTPKVQKLPPALFKAWVNLLCTTEDDGALPSLDDLSFSLRAPERMVQGWIDELVERGLLDRDAEGRILAHDWDEHQRKSDNVADRVAKHREKKRSEAASGNGSGPAGGNAEPPNLKQPAQRQRNVTGNTPDTETETEQNRTEDSPSLRSGGARAKPRTRMPDGWRPAAGVPAALEGEFAKFADHHRAKGTVFADWEAGWRTWQRKAPDFQRRSFAEPRRFEPAGDLLAPAPPPAPERPRTCPELEALVAKLDRSERAWLTGLPSVIDADGAMVIGPVPETVQDGIAKIGVEKLAALAKRRVVVRPARGAPISAEPARAAAHG